MRRARGDLYVADDARWFYRWNGTGRNARSVLEWHADRAYIARDEDRHGHVSFIRVRRQLRQPDLRCVEGCLKFPMTVTNITNITNTTTVTITNRGNTMKSKYALGGLMVVVATLTGCATRSNAESMESCDQPALIAATLTSVSRRLPGSGRCNPSRSRSPKSAARLHHR